MASTPKILLIYTGGTIGMIREMKTGALKAFDFDNLLIHIPELSQLNCSLESVSFETPIDSSNMNTHYWVQLLEIVEVDYHKYDGFVILHGSDTMSYTASALSFMIENLSKPIIFTGSQLPIGDIRTDAKENLITSIEIAASQIKGKPILSEVCLYFEYKLYRANRTTKVSSEQFEAYDSPNYPCLAESGVHLKFNETHQKPPSRFKKVKFHKKIETQVVILKLFPGITESVIKSILEIEELKGVVLETFGSGNAPTEKWFIQLLKKTLNKGIKIVNVTQCLSGNVVLGLYETSIQLQNIGLISGKDITTESALAKTMYLLGKKVPNAQFKQIFETPLRGEMLK
ncbi:MAG: asparaginase [Flavobacteriaceae bacterium]|nr:asparaginase [Flavobacteriaceae bacterium]